MSFWVTRKEPGKRRSIFTISIAWEFIPLLMVILAAIVVMLLKR